jgi:hypothetical protein
LFSATSALLLLVLMSATKWYGTVSPAGAANHGGRASSATAWSELSDVRWLLALTILAAFAAVLLHATQRSHGAQTDTSFVLATLGTLSAIALFVRVLVDLPAPHAVIDAKLGAYLGLLAAIGIALGGVESLQARRRDRRAAAASASAHRRVPDRPASV